MTLEQRQLSDKQKFVDLLKDLSARLTGIFAQDIDKLRNELLNDHINGLRTQTNHDPTMTDLQKEVETLEARLDSLIPTTGWDDLNKANTFSHNKIPSIICDIKELRRLSTQCHCTTEINALRTSLERKIANISIGKYRDELSALKAQIEIIANDVKATVTKLCQDL